MGPEAYRSLGELIASNIATASCAASCGKRRSAETIREAFRSGERAAYHGYCVPIGALLDLAAAAETQDQSLSIRERPISRVLAKQDAYDAWLDAFHGTVLQKMRRPKRLGVLRTDAEPFVYSTEEWQHLFLSAWAPNGHGHSPSAWAAMYRELQQSTENIRSVHAHWCDERATHPERWALWPDAYPSSTDQHVAPLAWARFASLRSSRCLHKTFDHAAADRYLRVNDPALSLEQQRRIHRMQQRTKSAECLPFFTAYSEQDPRYGKYMMSVLTQGEYGDFKLVNGSYPRINEPPRLHLRKRMEIHLTWICSAASALALFPEMNAPDGCDISWSTLTHQLAALLLDDYRNAFARLPVYFYAHRGWPAPMGVSLGKGGPRWKRPGPKPGNWGVPPASAASALFARPSCIDMALTDFRWDLKQTSRISGSSQDWWCGIMPMGDLEAFGFKAQDSRRPRTDAPSGWETRNADFPKELHHVVLLESGLAQGTLCEVVRTPDSVRLAVLCRVEGENPDGAFETLRERCMDLAIGALEERCLGS